MNLEQEIKRYSKMNGYLIATYEPINCACGGKEFNLHSDDTEGGAYAVCLECKAEHDLENSRQYIEEAIFNICHCDNDRFEIGVGKAYYDDSTDTQWVYVGASCKACELEGVYVDWQVR
ncbi:MAG: hypothetical protein COA78_03735 [Blastopirellula sp.]|nr:MAG: hypothetical protein COA78_03735 [Blastopirellula sp.]